MANPLPKEAEHYQQIKDENITIDPRVWTILYEHIGNALTVINFIATYYLSADKPIPVADARTLLEYSEKIRHALNSILYPDKNHMEDDLFKQILKENVNLHPIIREMLNHYIGNDMLCFNLIIGDCLDPSFTRDVPVESIHKIIDRTRTVREFMDRLREATWRVEVF